jgi:uncharacterized DUF497 family protein
MAKATFVWDDENIAHIGAHGLSPEEVEPVVNNPRNVQTYSSATGRSSTFGMTKTSKYIIVVWDKVKDRPWTVRVTTAYEVPRPKLR